MLENIHALILTYGRNEGRPVQEHEAEPFPHTEKQWVIKTLLYSHHTFIRRHFLLYLEEQNF